MTQMLACLAVLKHGKQITAATTQTASKHSSALASASTTPSFLSKTPTILTSHVPQHAVQATSNKPLAIPLAQDLPLTDGRAHHYKCALEVPDSLVLHMVRYQEWGLKQAHDLSSSHLATFVVGPSGEEGHWFITIRGTNQQIGEALIVIGKHIAKWHVHAPQKQKTGNAALGVASLAPSLSDSDSVSSTHRPFTQRT
ncbi:hypothetical protein C0995_012325 [Termitomyces sp. Mi166|nr:hypothetical protein C0995_012325 [Termitomyces sp. Mi166\